MAQVASQLRNVNAGRLRALVVPREHGAWGILLVPLITGAFVGYTPERGLSSLLLFLTASVALFWLRTPLESWLGTSPMRAQGADERRTVINAALATAAIATLSLLGLFWGGRNAPLLLIGCVAGTAFAVQAVVKVFGKSMRMPAQIIGAIGLTSTATGAYYVASGGLDLQAVGLWLATWLFACDQIHFVQLRVHHSRLEGFSQKLSRGHNFFVAQFGMLAAVLWACGMGLLPLLAIVAFVPVLVRGIAWFVGGPQPLQLHWLGITELFHSIVFGVLLISSFYIYA